MTTRFGLHGGFDGDDALYDRVASLSARLVGPDDGSVSAAAVIAALDALPFAGRVELLLRAVCAGPARDRLLRELFAACFVPAATDEVARDPIAAEAPRPLAPGRYPLLRVLTVALPHAGPLAVELFRAYQQTRGTALLPPFLDAMVASPHFDNEALEALFVGSVEGTRREILARCKRHPARAPFVGRLVAQGLAPRAMLPWGTSAALAAGLASSSPAEVAAVEALGFNRWREHAAVYLAHLRRGLGAADHDPLARGARFRSFEARARGLRPEDVRALFRACDEHRPAAIEPTVSAGVRAHLEALAPRGELRGAWEGVSGVLPDTRWWPRLSVADRLELLREAVVVTDRGWCFRADRESLCAALLARRPRHPDDRRRLLAFAAEGLAAVAPETAWELRVAAPLDPAARALRAFAQALDARGWSDHQLALAALAPWLALHRRTPPSPRVSARHAPARDPVELWNLWARSALDGLVALAARAAARAAVALQRGRAWAPRSTITAHVGFATILVGQAAAMLGTPGQGTGVAVHLGLALGLAEPFAALLRRTEGARPEPAVSPAAARLDALRATLTALVTAALDRLDAALVFDPASERYAPQAHHDGLAPLLQRVGALLPALPALRARLLTLGEAVHDRAELSVEDARRGFAAVFSPERTRFAPFDLAGHRAWTATALGIVDVARDAALLDDDELAARAWRRVAKARYGERLPSPRAKSFPEYLTELLRAPRALREGERPAVVRAAGELLRADALEPVAEALARLGWLDGLLEAADDAPALRDKYARKHGRVAVPAVRSLLEQATADRDPAARFAAHLALLQRSVDDPAELAASLGFVARRIRHEAGAHRPAVYQWLEGQAAAIVRATFDRDAPPALIDALCESLGQLARDDVSQRDTVGKSTFRRIAAALLAAALRADPTAPGAPLRGCWIRGAVALDAAVVRALHGEEGARSYVWPLPSEPLPVARSVPAAWLPALEAFFRREVRAGGAAFAELQRRLCEGGALREAGDLPPVDLAAVVDDLLGALPDRAEGATEAAGGDAFALDPGVSLRRAQALFALAGGRWTESPRLARHLAARVESLAATADPSPVAPCVELFLAVRGRHPPGSPWYEIPLLAAACEGLLDAAVRLGVTAAADAVLPHWRSLRLGRGATDLSATLDPAAVAGVVALCPGLEGRWRSPPADAPRRAALVRELLAKTPSAAYRVADELVALRDDLLPRFVRRPRGALRGVFEPPPAGGGEADARAPIAVAPKRWATFNAATLDAYTRDARDEAVHPALAPQARADALARYVASPAASPDELIDLLRAWTSSATAEEPVDDARPLLLEALMLGVFRTDAAWPVLAHLLRPEVLAAAPRTVSAALVQLPAWAPLDRLVAVLGALLDAPRRAALSASLHRALLRLLLETPHPAARARFAREWAATLHPDVRHEMVRLAVGSLADAEVARAEVAWRIVDDVARRADELSPATVSLLFLPTPPGSIEGLLRAPVPDPGLPDAFGTLHARWLGEPLAALLPATAGRLRAALRVVAAARHPYLRALATCKEATLSPAAVGDDDDDTLDGLHGLVLATVDPALPEGSSLLPLSPAEDYLLAVAPRVFATLCLQQLERRLGTLPPDARRAPRTLEALCAEHPAAARLRRLYGALLDGLVTTPAAAVERRVRLTRAARVIVLAARERSLAGPLLAAHFAEPLSLLRRDAEALTLTL